MKGIVLFSSTKAREVTIQDTATAAIVANIKVPINIQGIVAHCLVTYDKTDRIVTSLLSYEENSKKNDQTPGLKRLIHSNIYGNSTSASAKEGDIVYQRPNTGFLYLLRGLLATIGASTKSQLLFNGFSNSVKLIFEKLHITNGDTIDVSISSDTNSLPTVNAKIGNLYLSSNSTNMITMSLGPEIFSLKISKKGMSVVLFGKEILNKSIANDETVINVASKIRSQLVNVAIDIKDNASITVGKDFDVASQTMSFSADKLLSLSAQSLALFGNVMLRLDGQNVKINATGNQGVGGDVSIMAGKLAGVWLHGMDGSLRVKGTRVELLGQDEGVANGKQTKASLDALKNTVDLMIKVISAASKNPYCAALAPIDSASIPLAGYDLPANNVENKFVKIPLLVPNGTLTP